MSIFKRGDVYWYHFVFAGRHIQETTKTSSKTLAKAAEQRRRRELEEGFNSVADDRKDRIRTIAELAADYLEEYKLRHRSTKFAEYAVRHVTRIVGGLMTIEANEQTVLQYQTARLRSVHRRKRLTRKSVFFFAFCRTRATPFVRASREGSNSSSPLGSMLGAHSRLTRRIGSSSRHGAGDPTPSIPRYVGAELRIARQGNPKFAMGTGLPGRSLSCRRPNQDRRWDWPDHSTQRTALAAVKEYSEWYREKFGELNPDWFVFPFGNPQPTDPTKPCTSFKTVWSKIRADAGVKGRWHDNRHTLITELAESGAGDQTILDIAGHVSRQMLKHYSHIRMDAKRKALESIVATHK